MQLESAVFIEEEGQAAGDQPGVQRCNDWLRRRHIGRVRVCGRFGRENDGLIWPHFGGVATV